MVAELDSEVRLQREAVGQRIKEWPTPRSMSQADVAAFAGITQASLSNYENGKRDLPLSTLLSVTGALNVTLAEVLDVPEIIVVRDSALGKAVSRLLDHTRPADLFTSNGVN